MPVKQTIIERDRDGERNRERLRVLGSCLCLSVSDVGNTVNIWYVSVSAWSVTASLTYCGLRSTSSHASTYRRCWIYLLLIRSSTRGSHWSSLKMYVLYQSPFPAYMPALMNHTFVISELKVKDKAESTR